MTKKNLLLSVGILLALSIGFALTRHIGWQAGNLAKQPAALTQVHGRNFIQDAAISDPEACR